MKFQSRDVLAITLALAFALVVGALMFQAVPSDNGQLFAALAGVLGTLLTMVAKYYFPSDQGSDAKTATIADQAKALAAQPPVQGQ